MRSVALELVFRWACPECRRAHVMRPVVAEPTPEERAEIEELTGEPFEPGAWSILRHTVRCKRCGARFRTRHAD